MQILDKGEVRLLDHMGSDLHVVAAARVSNGVDFENASKGQKADQGLINYLIKHRHGSPFEHTAFQFYIKAPLFVRSQIIRHRHASYNEVSGRYVEYGGSAVEMDFYLPSEYRAQSESNKQGSVSVGPDSDLHFYSKALVHSATGHAETLYKGLVAAGVAKEMSRMILPQNLYTKFYMTINARSLMNFLSLRCAEDAQYETRQYALCMREIFKELMPMTYQAWETNEFIAP